MKKKKILAISALLSMLCIFCFKNYAYARWTGDWESVNTFYFTLKVGVGTDSYVMDTWCFDDKTLESVSNGNNLSSNCDAAMCIIRDAWWKPDHGGYSESGAITWSGSGLNWKASGDYEHDTPFIRIQIAPPAGYHLARVQDADGSNMKYSQSGDIIIAECGAIMGDWVSADKIPLSSYRQNGGISNISLIWEKDEVPSYNVDVNCYYWNDNIQKWVNEISNFSHVKVNHDNGNNWGTDDFFSVAYGSQYTVYAKPEDGWEIVGWADVESAKNESTSGEDLIKTPGLYTSTSSNYWTGTMNTITPGIYNSTETISVFVKKNTYSLTFDWDSGVSGVTGHNNDEKDIDISKNTAYSYTYGKTEPTFIFFNDGYEFDYVEETTQDHKQKHTGIDGSGTDNYGRYYVRENWSIPAYNRYFYIHTKAKKYTLTFDPNGGTLRNPGSNLYNLEWNNGNRVTVTYDTGNFCTMNDDCPTRTGYTFTGWYLKDSNGSLSEQIYDGAGNAINGTSLWGHWDNNWHWRYAGDVTVYAGWKANQDTSYTVRHWKQKLYIDGTTQYANPKEHNETNYFLADTDNLTGTTDSQVTPAIRNYKGFTAPDVQTVTIKPDGSLVVDYYYTRNRYKIDDTDNNDSGNDTGNTDSDKGNGIDKITGGGEYFFEEEVTMEAYVKTGYHWHNNDDCHTDISRYPTGWTVTKTGCGIDRFLDGTGYGSQKIKFIMPAHDVYIKADATNNSYTIAFDNNGGTGTMPQVSATYDVPVTLPANTFTRTTEAGTSTFLYWKFKDNNYVDNSVVNNLTSDFNGNVTLTAIWDDTPVITAQDRYFTVDDSQSGKITLEELLSTAKVVDDLDADITDKLTVKNYHPDNYNQFKSDGSVKIVYTVTDNSGNKAEISVMAYIVDTTAVEEEKNTYVRFIGPDYYQESYENGGLEENSIWRNDPEYAATLERAMQNRLSMTYGYNEATFFNIPIKAKKAASESRDHLVEQWVFTKEDIKAVKEYVNEHGIGNIKEPDALANFRLQFAHCKKQ